MDYLSIINTLLIRFKFLKLFSQFFLQTQKSKEFNKKEVQLKVKPLLNSIRSLATNYFIFFAI
ncbi:hypothetical protein DRF65_15100 [Chryseobacterium pennae]|uniref:Uncharacterized protein n=1 Tax=Chryseobacterium pennae TaxID=2258962 RepID=A0A3D9C6I9_9FLAO|nr:hypothetical protein DRF65_15100 [Chryseobacterium pennae]